MSFSEINNIPDDIKKEIMKKLGVSEGHIDEALQFAEKSSFAGKTPFLNYIAKAVEYVKNGDKWTQLQSNTSVKPFLATVIEALENDKSGLFDDINTILSEDQAPSREDKTEKSKSKREEGNKFFKEKKFEPALEAYTEAGLQESGEDASLAIANRSAVFFHLHEYEDCISDCDVALALGYPQAMQYKLWDRKGRAYLALDEPREAEECSEMAEHLLKHAKLSDEAKKKFVADSVKNSLLNTKKRSQTATLKEAKAKAGSIYSKEKKAPCEVTRKNKNENSEFSIPLNVQEIHEELPPVSRKVSIKYEKSKGRYCIANQDILPGEVVLRESPVTWFLSQNKLTSNCYYCCRPLSRTTYPAPVKNQHPGSTVPYLVCSLHCFRQTEASNFANFEVKLPLQKIFQNETKNTGYDELSGAILLVLRVILQEKMEYFLQAGLVDMDCHPQELQGPQHQNQKPIELLFRLMRHHESRTAMNLLHLAVKAHFILVLLNRCGYHCDALTDEKTLQLGEVVFVLLEALKYNTHPIDEASSRVSVSEHLDLVEVGSAVYPTLAATFNHSCDPSTIRVNLGHEVVVLTRRLVRKGEEITDCYGFHYTSLPRDERKNRIERWYSFVCSCEACSKEFPIMGKLVSSPNQKFKINIDAARREFESNKASAFQRTSQFLCDLSSSDCGRPNKIYEACSHVLSCCLWKFCGNQTLANRTHY